MAIYLLLADGIAAGGSRRRPTEPSSEDGAEKHEGSGERSSPAAETLGEEDDRDATDQEGSRGAQGSVPERDWGDAVHGFGDGKSLLIIR